MSAARHCRPAADLVERLCPLARPRERVFPWKERHPYGHLNPERGLSRWIALTLVIEEEGGVDRDGHPINGDVRQQFVFTETTLNVAVAVAPIFFFNDTPTTEIYTLSLHDALSK